MPSRVSQGSADFEETLFIKFHVYCSYGNGGKKQQLKFEPRPFWIYAFAVDAKELEFGRNSVDLSGLIQESVEKSYQGTRVRQWDMSFNQSGKAKGGELIVKLGFQIMEKDGGIGIYNQSKTLSSSSFARKQSRTSFSVPSPRLSSRSQAWTPSQTGIRADLLQGLDDLNLEESAPAPASSSSAYIQKTEEAEKTEDVEFPDFEYVDKGVEIQEKEEAESGENKSASSSEIVKEMVHHDDDDDDDQLHLTRLTELDSIAQQIKALETMMGKGRLGQNDDEETESIQRLDADEETITREFLQLEKDEISDSKVYLPDLGKGLGCVVQTRDGGYLVSMNPLDSLVDRKDTPKLAMQMSKPMVFVQSDGSILSGFELFQKIAGVGLDKLGSQILSLMPLDELEGKTAEQIAFEGIASAIIHGRNKEGASSSAARIIAAVKNMANATSGGRKERIASGNWNVNENPLTAEEILGFSLQKIEGMAVEALKVQADMAEEDAPFDVSAIPLENQDQDQLLASAIPLENWIKDFSLISSEDKLGDREPETLTLAVVVQLRDPLRRYEAVGSPVLAVIHASGGGADDDDDSSKLSNKYDEEKRFKVTSLDVGGLKVRTAGKRNLWDTERHRLTAMQWLVEYGLGKPEGRKGKKLVAKGQDMFWSISSRVMADMWFKTMRNPDVKFAD